MLQTLVSALSLIDRRASDADAVRTLARMAAKSAERGAATTGRLLTFARQGELRAEPVAPRPLLEELTEILAPTLGPGIAVRIDGVAEGPSLLADKAQLEAVLVNLAVNARDAMPDGGILTIAVHPETVVEGWPHPAGLRAGGYLRLDLTDTGIGMDGATLARAAEPFFTTKPLGQGTGLGLSMARGFAQQSGGSLTIRSSPGQGTTVTLWFPQAASEVIEAGAAHSNAARPPATPASVLVVDDDAAVREVLAREMAELGYQVVQVADALSTLARLDAGEKVELLVTDFSMPGMNGLLLAEEARRRRPGLPVLLLTGYADANVTFDIESIRNEITVLLRKPISGSTLAKHAAALLAREGVD